MDSQEHVGRGHALHRWLLAVALGLVLVLGLTSVADAASPPMNKWVDPLPVPPVATKTFKPGISSWADYYEINMTASQHQFNRDAGPGDRLDVRAAREDARPAWPDDRGDVGPARGGQVHQQPSHRPRRLPAEGARSTRLSPERRDLIGEVPTGAAIPHLHGGHTAARFDGTPMQWWTADGVKGEDYVTNTFTYLNDQPATLEWYHDHTMGATRFKPYLGLAAAYVIFDKVDNGTTINGQKVPSGYGKYHLPLVIQDKQFNDDGTLF